GLFPLVRGGVPPGPSTRNHNGVCPSLPPAVSRRDVNRTSHLYREGTFILQSHSSGGTVRNQATMALRSASVMFAYQANAMGGFSTRPSREIPWVIARLISVSVQAPMPDVECDVMFLATEPSHALGSPLTSDWSKCLPPLANPAL